MTGYTGGKIGETVVNRLAERPGSIGPKLIIVSLEVWGLVSGFEELLVSMTYL